MTPTGTPLSVQTHVSVPHCDIAIVSMDPCICPTLQHCYHQYGPMYLCHTATLLLSVLTHVSVPQSDVAVVKADGDVRSAGGDGAAGDVGGEGPHNIRFVLHI